MGKFDRRRWKSTTQFFAISLLKQDQAQANKAISLNPLDIASHILKALSLLASSLLLLTPSMSPL